MFEKLDVFCKRLEEINQKLCDPSVLADTSQYTSLLKESSSIAPIVEKYQQYRRAVQQEAEALEMLSENDKELHGAGAGRTGPSTCRYGDFCGRTKIAAFAKRP